MKKIIIGILVFLGVSLGVIAILLYSEISTVNHEKITEDLFVLKGAGGNVAVLRTSEGAVIVDTMTTVMQGGIIRELAEELTGQKVVLVINTHYHLDHTHGNPGFDKGVRVVSTENTLKHLKAFDADHFSGDAEAFLPTETFKTEKKITLGGKTIQLLHPGRGHTDGDLIAFFVEENTVHMGDLYFNGHYPNIDHEAGASIKEWDTSISNSLKLPFSKVIPGHGSVTGRPGLLKFQKFIHQLGQIGFEAVKNGTSKEAFISNANLTEDLNYKEIKFAFVPFGLDREFVLERSFEEATQHHTEK